MAKNVQQNVAPQGVRPQGMQGRPQGRPMPQGGRPMQGARPQGRPMAGNQPAVQKKAKKRSRKESDFFYVNRKGPCFLIFVFLLIAIIFVAANFLGCMSSLKDNSIVKMAVQYTAIYQIRDMTPTSERDDEYVDQTKYIGLSDLFFGALNGLTKKDADTSTDAAATETAVDSATEDVADATSAKAFDMSSPFYDGYKALAKEKEFESGLPLTIVQYAPFAIALFALFALWYMVKAFASLFGKRVYKNFGLGSILMLVCAAAVFMVSISLISIYGVEAGEKLALQFSTLGDYFGGAFSSVPKDVAAADEAAKKIAEAAAKAVADGKTPAIQVPFVAGYGQLIMLGIPVLTLVLSFGARRKIPYSIFD